MKTLDTIEKLSGIGRYIIVMTICIILTIVIIAVSFSILPNNGFTGLLVSLALIYLAWYPLIDAMNSTCAYCSTSKA